MRRAYSYKRFSSPKQQRGDSMRRQTEFEQRVVKEMELQLDDTLDLSDTGVSAFRGKNVKFGALAEFMQLVETGRIAEGSVLVVENIDRLSRENVFDAFGLFSRIINAGLTIVTAEPYDVYDKASIQENFVKLLIPLVYMMRAHDESKMKSHRVHQAWTQKRKRAVEEGKPLTERCPMWLRVVGKKTYEVVEDRAEVIRKMFRWTQEGLGTQEILYQLVADGTPSFGKKIGWHRSYIRKLLAWRAVTGEMQPFLWQDGKRVPTGDPIAGYFPAIISREEFDVVRAMMKNRRCKFGRTAKGDGNLFTGIVWHAVDRCRMSLRSNNQSVKRYCYLTSNAADKGAKAGEGRRFPYQKFEETVLAALAELRAEHLVDQTCHEKSSLDAEMERVSRELLVLDERQVEVEGEILDPTNGTTASYLLRQMKNLAAVRSERVKRLQSLREQAKARDVDPPAVVQTVVELLGSTSESPERVRLRRKIKTRIRLLVDSIWVHIEKVNHSRQFAHVQLFLRTGERRDVVVSSFTPKAGRPDTPPARRYDDVDFRTYTPTPTRGRGRLRDQGRDDSPH